MIIYSVLTALVVFIMFPIAWMAVTSFKLESELYSIPAEWIPRHPTLANYEWIVNNDLFPRYFLNSFIVAASTTLVTLPITSFTAYSFSRLPIRGRRSFLHLIVMTQMLPDVLLLVSLYVIMKELGLIDTLLSLVLTYITFNFPFCTLMMKSYFDGVPVHLEEAAMVDGCGRLGALRRISLPLVAPGMIATAIMAFILAWNEFLFALTFINSPWNLTVTVGLRFMATEQHFYWNRMMAGALLMAIPVAILFMFLQKHLVRGLTAGAIKG
jgi:ABC-type glycerol-3-phosphate transport system permease component